MPNDGNAICVVGLGYVGLPLAHAFAEEGNTVYGFDISEERITELSENRDSTHELRSEQLESVDITFSADPAIIEHATIIILAIPTPVDNNNQPDLSLVESASKMVGKHLTKGSIVVYESTVYPGVTEEICGPILERESGLRKGTDFKLGYSPERINPGDKEHTIRKILKIVAGEDEETTNVLADLYGSIVEAGIHKAPNIKVAEMAKAIENAQRDLNIAYVNEIALLCEKIGICTIDVLNAARTKWNFLGFEPGLVGGHCIGVDPYYLLTKAKDVGVEMPIVTAARSINDSMAQNICRQVISALQDKGKSPNESTVLVLGLTFKENVPDTRNSKAGEVVECLIKAGCTVTAHDPYVQNGKALSDHEKVDAIVLLVPHKEYKEMSVKEYAKLGKEDCIFYDLKSLFEKSAIEEEGLAYIAL